MSSINHLETVALRKIGSPLPEGVGFCYWEHKHGTDLNVVKTSRWRISKRGPSKGQRIYYGPFINVVYVVDSEIKAEIARFERETGKCHKCGGDGLEWSGWSHDKGTEWRPCGTCEATGISKKACVVGRTESSGG